MKNVIYVRLVEVNDEAPNILSYRFEALDSGELPAFTAGAHIGLVLPGRLVRYYSLCGSPQNRHEYTIAIQRELQGRGGSKMAHELLRTGKIVKMIAPRNHFELASGEHHLLIAGGIGITPMLSMVAALSYAASPFHLIVATKGVRFTPFMNTLEALQAQGVASLFLGGDPVDFASLIKSHPSGSHIYCCGSPGFMAAVRAAASDIDEQFLHFESFFPVVAKEGDKSFTLYAVQSQLELKVDPDVSILSALRTKGIELDSVCENGTCGSCKLRYTDGVIDHRDFVLSGEERATFLTACVSRALSDRITVDI